MPRDSKPPTHDSSRLRGRPPPLPVPVHCCGDGCEATTTFLLVGERGGYEGGEFGDPGWTIGVSESFEDSGGSFFCQKCFEKEQDEGHAHLD